MAKISRLINSKYSLVIILIIASFLRLLYLDKVPVSLFSDELDVGYQAYSMIKTGKDYMGNSFPLFFQSYADARAPVYIYLTIPFVWLFGITSYGVRLPAAIFGILGVWGMYLLSKEIAEYSGREDKFTRNYLPQLSALVLALSPWHIQYSRAAFEATVLIFFLLTGLYLFFKSLKSEKYLWLSLLCFGLMPWIYSTAKLFIPFLITLLIFIWRNKILGFSKKTIYGGILTLAIFFIPLVILTMNGTAGQRFSYISIFTDPTTSGEVASQRLIDAQVQGAERSIFEKVASRVIHNKYLFWSKRVTDNYLEAFSSQFLFLKGDLNLRHSPEGIGQFYKIEFFPLFLGTILFFILFGNRKIILFFAFWILVGILPSAVTRDGGHHATRLIIILPALVFLISYGILQILNIFGRRGQYLLFLYFGIWFLSFGFYLHTYYVHNLWYSERDWHAGYKEMIEKLKLLEGNYPKIIISNAKDDPKIFLASYYPINPVEWQKGFQRDFVKGFGDLEHIEKYFFGQIDAEVGMEKIDDYLDDILYIASEREIKGNLIMDPQKTPEGLNLVTKITYPSGEPAFYFFEVRK